jgi:hypothetical protein
MFYPDKKPHISPSAFALWHSSVTGFIKSYFRIRQTIETTAMKAGTKIHALIQGGFIQALNRFNCVEKELVVSLGGVKVLGRPDSHEENSDNETVSFVDYKTGKEDHWSREELATDLKMRMTAWLVLQANPGAKNVRAIIEYIGTEWNGTELVPTNEPHQCYEYIFTWEDLFGFQDIILNTVKQVNEAYEQFLLLPEEDFVREEDVLAYAELDRQITELEGRQDEIKSRVKDQLELVGRQSYEHELGTFFFRTSKKYEYPKTLKFITQTGETMTLEKGEEVELAMGAAKKNWELEHEPVSATKSLQFKSKKKK